MPDTAALKIINITLDSLDAEDTQKNNCNTNIDVPRCQIPSRKFMGMESAAQMLMAFSKLLTMTIGKLLILMETH